jgi:heme-degrading monooxygenase HmoA
MFVRIWQFHVRPEQAGQFRSVYGSQGAWASLFRRGGGYLGTELLESTTDPTIYLTVDRWESADAWAAFLSAWQEDYVALDRQCESLTVAEVEVGAYLHDS